MCKYTTPCRCNWGQITDSNRHDSKYAPPMMNRWNDSPSHLGANAMRASKLGLEAQPRNNSAGAPQILWPRCGKAR